MNRIFKVVFNHVLGSHVVVSEVASSIQRGALKAVATAVLAVAGLGFSSNTMADDSLVLTTIATPNVEGLGNSIGVETHYEQRNVAGKRSVVIKDSSISGGSMLLYETSSMSKEFVGHDGNGKTYTAVFDGTDWKTSVTDGSSSQDLTDSKVEEFTDTIVKIGDVRKVESGTAEEQGYFLHNTLQRKKQISGEVWYEGENEERVGDIVKAYVEAGVPGTQNDSNSTDKNFANAHHLSVSVNGEQVNYMGVHYFSVNDQGDHTEQNYSNLNARGKYSIALGINAYVENNADNSMALLDGSVRNGAIGSIAIGNTDPDTGRLTQVQEKAKYSYAIGTGAQAGNENNIAFGRNADAAGNSNTIAIGYGANTGSLNAIAIGTGAKANNSESAIAIGKSVTSSNLHSIAIGDSASVGASKKDNSIAIGYKTAVSRTTRGRGDNAIALGANSVAYGSNTVAIGSNTKMDYTNSTNADGGSDNSVAIGSDITVRGMNNTAIGTANTAQYSQYSGVIGAGNTLGANGDTKLSTSETYLYGHGNEVSRTANVSVIGSKNIVNYGNSNLVLGDYHTLDGSSNSPVSNNIILGTMDQQNGTNKAHQAVSNTVMIGHNADAQKDGSVAIGQNATVLQEGGVALGKESIADRVAGSFGEGINSAAFNIGNEASETWVSTAGAVSVGGGIVEGKTVTRQIANVAAGSADTDAVNVAQLKAVQTHYYSANDKAKVNMPFIGEVEVPVSKTNYSNDGATGIDSLAAGIAVGAAGNFTTVTGSFSSIGSTSTYQGTGASTYGGFNNIGAGDDVHDGIGNSLIGLANKTSNANGALIFGTGNEVTNSIGTLDGYAAVEDAYKAYVVAQVAYNAAPTDENKTAAETAYTALQSAMETFAKAAPDDGGDVLAIGGGNTAVYATKSSMIGVKNTIQGTSDKTADYNSTIGYNNTITDGKNNSIIGTNRTIDSVDGVIAIGSASDSLTTSVANSVVIGTDANVTLADKASVALGSQAIAERLGGYAKGGTDDVTVGNMTYSSSSFAGIGQDVVGTVSVGQAGKVRTLTNVGAGLISADSTDAINGSQLYQAILASQFEIKAGDNVTVKTGTNENGIKTYTISSSNATAVAPGANISVDGPEETTETASSSGSGTSSSGSGSGSTSATGAETGNEASGTTVDKGDYKTNTYTVSGRDTTIIGSGSVEVTGGELDKDGNRKYTITGTDTDTRNKVVAGNGNVTVTPSGDDSKEAVTYTIAGRDTTITGSGSVEVTGGDLDKDGNRKYTITGTDTNTTYTVEEKEGGEPKNAVHTYTLKAQETGSEKKTDVDVAIVDTDTTYKLGLKDKKEEDGKTTYTVELSDAKTGTSAGKVEIVDKDTHNGLVDKAEYKVDYKDGIGSVTIEDQDGNKSTITGIQSGGGIAEISFNGDIGDTVQNPKELNIVGEPTSELTEGNIGVVASQDGDNGKLTVKLVKDVDLGDSGSMTVGNTKIENNKVTVSGTTVTGDTITVAGGTSITGDTVKTTNVQAKTVNANSFVAGDNIFNSTGLSVGGGNVTVTNEGFVVQGGPSMTSSGISAGTKENPGKITNVKAGEAPTDAVNVSQLEKSNQQHENNFRRLMHKDAQLERKIHRTGAHAAALAALHPLDFDEDHKLTASAGVGSYHGSNAIAAGVFYRPDENKMFSLGVSLNESDSMVNAGFSYRFGTGSNDKTSPNNIHELKRRVSDLSQDNQSLNAELSSTSQRLASADKEIASLKDEIAQIKKILKGMKKK